LRSRAIDYTSTHPSHVYRLSEHRKGSRRADGAIISFRSTGGGVQEPSTIFALGQTRSQAAVDIWERSNVERLVLFSIQVAAVSFAETQIPEVRVVNQSLLKAGFCKAIQLEVLASDILIQCI